MADDKQGRDKQANDVDKRQRKRDMDAETERMDETEPSVEAVDLTGIDHFVLTVEDVEATCAFYEDIGGEIVTFGEDRKAIRFGDQKINLHPTDNDIGLVADEPTVGGGDFCLLTETPIEDVERRLRERGIEILEGPVGRTGAVGPITSVYLQDPDDNLVEIATYDDA